MRPTGCAAKAGMSLSTPAVRPSILCLPCATAPPPKSVQPGRDNQYARIGGSAIRSPSRATNEARRGHFLRVYKEIEHRIKIFTSLPMETLERFAIERRVREIGLLKLAG